MLSDGIPKEIVQQYEDNLRWLDGAGKNRLVVGSQARILYSDQQGRSAIAKAFNEAVASGDIKVESHLYFEIIKKLLFFLDYVSRRRLF